MSDQFYRSQAWRRKRLEGLKRDRFECVWCRESGKLTTKRLEVDHIKEYDSHPELGLELDNLRTLCHYCHNKRHNRANRWQFDERWDW